MYVIYALIDPRDNTVRYVGLTDDVYGRFLSHINCSGNNFAKNAWMMELRFANKMVIMETLEEVEDKAYAQEREGYWIKHFQSLAEPIMNVSKTFSPRKSKKANLVAGKRFSATITTFIEPERHLVKAEEYMPVRFPVEHLGEARKLREQGASIDSILRKFGLAPGGRNNQNLKHLLEQAEQEA